MYAYHSEERTAAQSTCNKGAAGQLFFKGKTWIHHVDKPTTCLFFLNCWTRNREGNGYFFSVIPSFNQHADNY